MARRGARGVSTAPTPARVGLYYAPAIDDPLWSRAAAWLGRDPETNAPCKQPDLPDIAGITADPRGYGFHATLKPPMRLRAGVTWNDVVTATEEVAAGLPAFDLPPMAVTDLQGFLALCDTTPSTALQACADLCAVGLDHLREPPDAAEIARRTAPYHSPAHKIMLARWGYPYMFATWFFHMTLTRRLSPAEKAIYMPAAEAHFGDLPSQPRRVTDLCLYTQAAIGAPFTLAMRFPLRG
jgi:hypothetical protein